MATTTVRFLSVLFAALALAPALAHLFELPNKIGLSRDEYLTVQQIYSGWALLGFVVWAALLSSLALTLLVRKRRREFVPALIGFLSIAGTQVVFWTLTFPTNELTANWTVLPDNWAALRLQWEYSHAASAVLNLIALVAIIASVLARDDSRG
jgi:membrane protease YdiL (CAAX protease family)